MRTDAAPIFHDADALARHLARRAGSRVVLADGCFDPLHVGHVRYLAGARACGDFLVVALYNDRSTRARKGEGRPVITEADRARLLAAVRAVDAVLIVGEPDVAGVLRALHPACHARGPGDDLDTGPERETVKRLRIETVIVGGPKSHSSSDVVASLRGREGESG
jgi:rfaE bifunctional protein nucleotidyltransferase chain/domain